VGCLDSRLRGNDEVEIVRFAKKSNGSEISLVYQSPVPRLRLERQMVSGEDCLNEVSSAAAQMRR
jgi:hypothetical protein